MEKRIRILIADDLEAHRRRLERAISKEPSMELLKSAINGYETVLFAGMYNPDIILMDIEMENKYAGITAAKQINEKLPHIKILVLTVHEDDNIIFSAFQTGIIDYIVKTAPIEIIIEAIKLAYNNLSPIRPIVAQKIRNEFKRIKTNEENLLHLLKIISNLTPSELEILRLLCENKTRNQIAAERCVELDTVKKQITSILKKFSENRTRKIVAYVNELKIFDVLKSYN